MERFISNIDIDLVMISIILFCVNWLEKNKYAANPSEGKKERN